MALMPNLAQGVDHYCVFGNPVAHSRSPQIHAAFARQTGENIDYCAIEVPTDAFAEYVLAFRDRGGKGASVTLPFKLEAHALCDKLGPRADISGTVNTLRFLADGSIHGENTDGSGLVRDLESNQRVSLHSINILLLGAGGAARAVVPALLQSQPQSLFVANRTPEKALAIAERFKSTGCIAGGAFADANSRRFDLIINATAASLGGEVPPLAGRILGENTCCYDMMYGREPTTFLRWAAAQGAGKCVDGLGMLVEQAAEAFQIWRGIRPTTGPVLAALRESMDE